MPDLFHVVPVGNDTMLDRILQRQDTSLRLGLITDVRVLLSHTDHDTLMARPADDRRENGAGGVIPGESGLAHTGSIVDYERGNFLVAHVCSLDLSAKENSRLALQEQSILTIS